jgi:hypothetical protein
MANAPVMNEEEMEFKASNLTISTCTVLCNLNKRINLELFTRFLPIYDVNAPELDEKKGGVYNMEFYGNCARGETGMDKINSVFNNQTSIKFKYWGFRMLNVKIFRNGRLQLTGLKYEDEAKLIGNLLINIIKGVDISVNLNLDDVIATSRSYDMQMVYNPSNKKVTYYRRYYKRFLNNYKFNLEEAYTAANAANTKLTINLKGKNFKKGIQDLYIDSFENDCKEKIKELEYNHWFGDSKILKIIDMLEFAKGYITKEVEKILTSSVDLKKLLENILKFQKEVVLDFKNYSKDKDAPVLKSILDNIAKNIYPTDEQTLIEVKSDVHEILKDYLDMLSKKITRLIFIRNSDINITNILEEYISANPNIILSKQTNKQDNKQENKQLNMQANKIVINMHDLDPSNIKGSASNMEYSVSGIETVMINSDLFVNYNINLKKMAKILKKRGLFNTYDPEDHSGVNLKFYWNRKYECDGICRCNPHCSTKEKKSVCNRITVLIFRPGSIIITGSRTIEQLRTTHDFTIKLLKETMEAVRIDERTDDTKQVALLNNEFRKISRKPRLFYIKKDKIQQITQN